MMDIELEPFEGHECDFLVEAGYRRMVIRVPTEEQWEGMTR